MIRITVTKPMKNFMVLSVLKSSLFLVGLANILIERLCDAAAKLTINNFSKCADIKGQAEPLNTAANAYLSLADLVEG